MSNMIEMSIPWQPIPTRCVVMFVPRSLVEVTVAVMADGIGPDLLAQAETEIRREMVHYLANGQNMNDASSRVFQAVEARKTEVIAEVLAAVGTQFRQLAMLEGKQVALSRLQGHPGTAKAMIAEAALVAEPVPALPPTEGEPDGPFAKVDPLSDAILAFVRAHPGVKRSEIHQGTAKHRPAQEIGQVLDLLQERGLIHCETVPTAGRPAEAWHPVKT